jgi:hypothetical protein
MLFTFFRDRDSKKQKQLRELLTESIKTSAPKKYVESLIPKDPPGCRRLVLDAGYIQTLHRSNMDIEWDHIAEVVEDGIVTKSGKKHPLDVIIYATGFDLDAAVPDLTGINGETVREYFARKGGPTAYCGTCLPIAPNFLMLTGPNGATGHSSVLFVEESQVDYAAQLIETVVKGDVKSFCPTEDATDKYDVTVQARFTKTVWPVCHSWFRAGADGQGKIQTVFPGFASLYWWWLKKPIWKDFAIVGGEQWKRHWKRNAVMHRLMQAGLLSLGVLAIVKFSPLQTSGWSPLAFRMPSQ